MPGRTDNSFTRPLPYYPTSTCGITAVCSKSIMLRIYIERSAPFFQTSRATRLVLQPPPEPAARRYIASPRTEPVTAGFLRAAVAALHAQPAPVRLPPRPPGVISRLPVPNRSQLIFLGSQRNTARPDSAHTPPTPTSRYRPRPKSCRNATCKFVCSSHGQQPCLRLIPGSCRTKNKKTH